MTIPETYEHYSIHHIIAQIHFDHVYQIRSSRIIARPHTTCHLCSLTVISLSCKVFYVDSYGQL